MSIKIGSKIVGYAIKQPGAQNEAEPAQPTKDVMHEDVARPKELRGYTYKIKPPTADHAMYITINDITLNEGTDHEQEYPFEIFINSKNMEQFQWILALTRVISAVFRKGGDTAFLAEELKQVFDPHGGYYRKGGKFVPSLVADIGTAIETHMKKIGLIQEDVLSQDHQDLIEEKRGALEVGETDVDPAANAQLCMKCHTVAVVQQGGCLVCLSCGDSKCS